MRPVPSYHPRPDNYVETRAEMRARVATPRGRDPPPSSIFSVTSIAFTLLAFLTFGAVPGATAQNIDCASTTAALGILGACTSGADAACCAALESWNSAGCFCDGVETAVSQSSTYSAQVTALAAACSIEKAEATTHELCGGGAETTDKAKEPSTPSLPNWAYMVHDNSNPYAPAFKLTWSAATSISSDETDPVPNAAFVVTHCSPGNPPTQEACGASVAQTVVNASPTATEYTLSIAQTPADPVTAFVSLHAIAADTTMSEDSLGPWDEIMNYGGGIEPARVFVTANTSAAAANNTCGDWWSPCSDVTVAIARAVMSGTMFTETAPMEIVLLPGEHSGTGNCGVELGVTAPVRIFGIVPPPSSVASDDSDSITPPARFASLECGASADVGGFTVKAPNAVTLENFEIKNATRTTGGGLFITGDGASATVSNVLVANSKAGGAGGGIAVADGADAAFTDVAVVACAGGADESGNEVRGGGIYVTGASTTTTLTRFIADTCTLPVENGKGAGVNIDSGASVTADGLVVKNSISFFAAGIFVGTGCSPVIRNAVIENNTATYGAGVASFAGSFPVLQDCLIKNNQASEWGGGVLAYTMSTMTLKNSTVEGNSAQLGGGAHGYVKSVLQIEDGSVVSKNTASLSGGGVYLNTDATGVFQGESTSVTDNTAADIDGGGGVAISAGASATFRDSFSVVGNTADRGPGGGVICTGAGSSLSIRENVSVTNNVAHTRGGGVLASRGCVVEIDGSSMDTTSRSVLFSGNTVSVDSERCRSGVFGGGAVALEPNIDETATSDVTPTTLRARFATFRNNSAPDGGAFFVALSDEMNASGDPREVSRAAVVDVTFTDVVENEAAGCVGSGHSEGCSNSLKVSSSSAAALYLNVTNPDTSVVGGEGGGIFAASGTVALNQGSVLTSNEASDSGGAVRTTAASSLFVSGPGTSFLQNVARAGAGGGIAHKGLAFSLLGPDLTFSDNKALDGGALSVEIEPTTATLVASRASFFFERANVTGAPANANVDASSFDGNAFFVSQVSMDANVAGRRGGGVFVSSPLNLGVFRDLTVSDAQAVAGTSVYWTRATSPDAALECQDCDLGNEETSVDAGARRLSMTGESTNPPAGVATEALSVSFSGGVEIPDEVSSATSAPQFAASLVDFYGRVAATENGVNCRLEAVKGQLATSTATDSEASTSTSSDTLELAGALASTSESGIVVFDGVVPRGQLGSTYQARIACDYNAATGDDSATVQNSTVAVSVAPMTFSVRIAECTRGFESVVSSTDAITNDPVAKDCVACKDRTFNFDGVSCVACPPGGDCPGGDAMLSRDGWWRSAEDAEVLFACPTKTACLSGTAVGDDACAEGYAGPVCAMCETGFRQWGKACVPCEGGQTYALPILAILCGVAFVYYIFREPSKKKDNATSEDGKNKPKPDSETEAKTEASVALFSSLVFIAQCLGLLKEYDVAFPQGVDRLLDALDLTNFNLSALAPGCTDDSVNFYRSFTVGVLAPPLILAACGFLYYQAEQARKRHYKDFPSHVRTEHDAYETLKRRCLRNAAWMLTLAYSGTAKTTFQLYNARRLDTGSFLRRDFSINVDGVGGEEYNTYAAAGVLALLAYPLGIPLVIAFLLRRGARDGKLQTEVFKQKYGFLYQAYKPRFVIWELAGLCTKCFLAAVPVFATESTLRGGSPSGASDGTGGFDVGAGGGFALACQSTLAQAACLSLLVAILWLRPHKNKLHSAQQATAAAVVLGWVLVLGNVLNVDSASDDSMVAFDEEEKFRVCFAAVAATMAAVLAMIVSSFFAGELDASASVNEARKSFARLTSRKSNVSADDDAERGETRRSAAKNAKLTADEDDRRSSFYEPRDELNSSTVEVHISSDRK